MFLIQFIKANQRPLTISAIFLLFNVMLPLLVIDHLVGDASTTRYTSIMSFKKAESMGSAAKYGLWLLFFLVVCTLEVKFFRIRMEHVKKYYLPSLAMFGLLIINVVIPLKLLFWGIQDQYDHGMGINSEPFNPNNPMRPFYRIIFAGVVTVGIYGLEILASKYWFDRKK